jgi:hypothetical protein
MYATLMCAVGEAGEFWWISRGFVEERVVVSANRGVGGVLVEEWAWTG